MTARAALAAALWDNYTVAEKEQFIDDYAHELAEKIRAHDYDPGEVGPVHLAYQSAADLIDPVD